VFGGTKRTPCQGQFAFFFWNKSRLFSENRERETPILQIWDKSEHCYNLAKAMVSLSRAAATLYIKFTSMTSIIVIKPFFR